jgi:flagella basal body P-ring formation protein FlgA
MRKASVLLTISLLGIPLAADAAMLRPFSEITAGTVRLGDLFDQLGTTPDRVLGKGPSPGERIKVGAAQLAAIARDFNVDWRPQTGNEQAVVERKGKTIQPANIAETIRKSLILQGAPPLSDVDMPESQPIIVPVESVAEPNVTHCSYDPASGHFMAVVSVADSDGQPVEQHISGTVIPLAVAAVAVRRISHGSPITDEDFRTANVRLAALHGAAAVLRDHLTGMIAKRDILPGQALTVADIAKPELVVRGSIVRMQLLAGGIALSAEGIAKDSGARGDQIRVENPISHATVKAEIVGEGEVRVDPNRSAFTLAAAQ